jgi:hypothetical protein
MMHGLDILEVLIVGLDIGIVDIIGSICLREKELQLAALGIDIVMAACAQMFYQGARLAVDIDLDAVDIAVAEVGNRKVNHAVSAQEGECSDGTIILEAFHPNVS